MSVLDYRKNGVLRHVLLKSSNLFLAVSNVIADLAKDLGAANVKILPNGVDVEKFTFESKDALTHGKGSNIVLFVGRLDRRKGVHILLNSLNLLKTSINLVLIGPSYDNKYSKEIMSQIENENKKGRHVVTYLGPMHGHDLVKWYKKASIFVCPSLSESFGVVNIEAMSCGTPVISSDISAIRDI